MLCKRVTSLVTRLNFELKTFESDQIESRLLNELDDVIARLRFEFEFETVKKCIVEGKHSEINHS